MTAGLPAWTPFERAYAIPADEATMKRSAEIFRLPLDQVRVAYQERMDDELWKNSRYQVVINRNPNTGPGWPAMIHLSIKRLDREPIHDWRDLQRIKNELLGPDFEAVELYPNECRLTDTANQYHLWALGEPGMAFPFGFLGRNVTGEDNGKSKQRPFEQPGEVGA